MREPFEVFTAMHGDVFSSGRMATKVEATSLIDRHAANLHRMNGSPARFLMVAVDRQTGEVVAGQMRGLT